MTLKRDKKADIKKTNSIILKTVKPKNNGESWLGHTKDGGIIDYELLNGASVDELVVRSGRTLGGVNKHLYHLKDEHGLQLSKTNNIYKFEYYLPQSNQTLSKIDLQSLMNIDIENVKKNCIVQLENKDGVNKWYSIGIEAQKKDDDEILSLNIEKAFAKSLLNKRVGDYINFGSGFKVVSIKKYLSN